MAAYKLFVLPGDGIGPEVMDEAGKIAAFLTKAAIARFEIGHIVPRNGARERAEAYARPIIRTSLNILLMSMTE